jgi:hypothetical protein
MFTKKRRREERDSECALNVEGMDAEPQERAENVEDRLNHWWPNAACDSVVKLTGDLEQSDDGDNGRSNGHVLRLRHQTTYPVE